MLSALTQAEIINGAVLAATLHGDLGARRRIGPLRLLRPLLVAGGIVPLFIDPVVTRGTGFTLEVAATAAGLACGLAAVSLMRVYRSESTGRPVTAAGWPYALLWTVLIGARAAFSYGSFHWFPQQLAHWCAAHQVTGAAITDAMIFMAVTMVVTRTVGIAVRAAALPRPASAPVDASLTAGAR